MPTKRVIVLERMNDHPPPEFRVAFWADVPVARQSFYADPSKASVWSGATVAENTSLKNGAVLEMVDTVAAPPNATLAEIQAILENRWATFQAEVNNAKKWTRYGTVWDGTTWTAGGS